MKKLTPRSLALSLEYHLFKKDKALLRPLVSRKLQAILRRRARAKYLVWDAGAYREWMKVHLAKRQAQYKAELEFGLFSVATPVWDGTPIQYLQLLANSLAEQNSKGACEWVVLDNGTTKHAIRRYLDNLAARYSWIRLHRERRNEGIIGGLRLCLEQATGRYFCPVDSDDLLYPDCLQIVQWWIQQNNFAPLFYSDEDKLIGTHHVQPYFKPDFDPVLLANSAYIAHLGVIDRAKALELGAYSDRDVEGSPDWDCFLRFYAAGYAAIHIPEVIYSWRMHPESTADDAGSKPYIHKSQQAVLNRYLAGQKLQEKNDVKYSPLLPGSADWWVERRHLAPQPALLVTPEKDVSFNYPNLRKIKWTAELSFSGLMNLLPNGVELVCLLHENLLPERDDCLWEAQGLFERFPDAVMVGGWIAGSNGAVQDGPLVLGFQSDSACPDYGRTIVDPGYFTQMRKQHSVSAISSRFAVLRCAFLRDALSSGQFAQHLIEDCGLLLGEFARERNQRIIYSPFLRCNEKAPAARKAVIPQSFSPDHRFYPRHFGMMPETAYRLQTEK